MATYTGRVRVISPHDPARLVLRSELDWNRDVRPDAVDPAAGRAEFTLSSDQPYLAYKPCLALPGEFRWSVGANKLALLASGVPTDVYPHFYDGMNGRITPARRFRATALDGDLGVRVYLPAGYDENTRKRFPVLYMHDGRNLFFPEEAFGGNEWQVDETLERLDTMNVIDQLIVVGVQAPDRTRDYTEPGLAAFTRALVDELRPAIEAEYRALTGPRETGVIGSSLGGVAALYQAWHRPDVFGLAGCLSSTFGYADSLLERVRADGHAGRESLRLYLDSGWPGDNYEPTLAMAAALVAQGFRLGTDLVHLAFPLERHTETAWSARLHLSLQLFTGKLRRLERQRGG